jgi:Tol biopolymer transport system component
MTVSAPPRPPSPTRTAPDSKPLEREEIEALVEALIEEARRETRRRHRTYRAVAALVAFLGVVVLTLLEGGAASHTASPALSARMSAAAQAASSKIAYIRGVPNRPGWAVYVMNADGSGQRKLSHGVESLGGVPVWSPDGQRIAFDGNEFPRKSDVYVMNADGSGQQRLTRNPAGDTGPAWSPDGQRLAFASYRNRGDHWDVSVMNADGSDRRSLTRSPAHDFGPAWSPDGQRLAFTRSRRRWSPRCTSSCVDVYVMNADGSGQRNLTPGLASGEGPAWSPGGRKIAFLSNATATPRSTS